MDSEPNKLTDVISELYNIFELVIREKGLELNVYLDEDLLIKLLILIIRDLSRF